MKWPFKYHQFRFIFQPECCSLQQAIYWTCWQIKLMFIMLLYTDWIVLIPVVLYYISIPVLHSLNTVHTIYNSIDLKYCIFAVITSYLFLFEQWSCNGEQLPIYTSQNHRAILASRAPDLVVCTDIRAVPIATAVHKQHFGCDNMSNYRSVMHRPPVM